MKKKRVKERATFSRFFCGPPPFPPRFSIAGWSVCGEAKKRRGETFTRMAIVISRLFSPTRFARGAECARQRMKAMIDRYFPRAHFFACVAFCPNPSPAGGSARVCVWRMSKKVGEERYFISTFLNNFRFFFSFFCLWLASLLLFVLTPFARRAGVSAAENKRRETANLFCIFLRSSCCVPVGVRSSFVRGSECVRRRRKRRGGGTFYVL